MWRGWQFYAPIGRASRRVRGRFLRSHQGLGPTGANVNFVSPPPSLGRPGLIRTFERGVEGETLACGTGACASAVAAIATKRARSPVRVDMTGGSLMVSWEPGQAIRMRGAATHVFSGELDLEALQ